MKSQQQKRKQMRKYTYKPISKTYLEDLVVGNITRLLSEDDTIDKLAQLVFEAHQRETQDNTTLNLLKRNRDEAHRAGQNMLKAIEMGIINEMTRTRFAELETQIAQLDIEIEKEMQRCHATLTIDQIKSFLTQFVFADATKIEVRKTLINTFVRSVIIYVDRVVVVYNFAPPTEHVPPTSKTLKAVEKALADTPMIDSSTILEQRPPPTT